MVVVMLCGCGRLSFDPLGPLGETGGIPDAGLGRATSFGPGCVVGLTMDEAAWTGAGGEVLDVCGGENPGFAVQGATPAADPVRDRAGEFPLPSACVHIADSAELHATTGLTMSAWLFPRTLDGVNPYGVIAKRTDFAADDAEYTMFIWTDNTVWVDIDSRDDRNHGNRSVINGQWQQITAVYDGTLPMAQRVKIYIDGELDAVLAETSTTLTARANPLSIGCLPQQPVATTPQIAFGGELDDVGIWARAFSAEDVLAWYQATRR
jgi:hypothetical protein